MTIKKQMSVREDSSQMVDESRVSKTRWLISFLKASVMNFYIGFYIDYFSNIETMEDSRILDIGCGGGKFIKLLANELKGEIVGVDNSDSMVNIARKTNADLIKTGRVKINQGSVMNLPHDDNTFDIITACRTISLWPDLKESLREVHRTLSAKGTFIVIDRYPSQTEVEWQEFIEKDEFSRLLNELGFKKIVKDTEFKKKWIIVTAQKDP